MSLVRRLLFWLMAVAAYWYCARWLLYSLFPIFVDGSGPMPSYFWGNAPASPTMGQWNTSLSAHIAVEFPYLAAASAITLLGCGLTTWLVRIWKPPRTRLFRTASTATLVSLLLLQAASDTGTALHFWRGPTMYGSLHSIMYFVFKTMIPVSLLAGVVALLHRRLNHVADDRV